MNEIIQHLLNMIPYMLISIPIIIFIRLKLIKRKNIKLNYYHEIGLILFIVFLVGLFSQTIIPKLIFTKDGIETVEYGMSSINYKLFEVFRITKHEVFVNNNINYFLINFLGNIIMFIPIGVMIPLLFKNQNCFKVILIALLISIFIEISQLFLTRGTDIDDLWLNTLGTIIGLILYKIINKLNKNFTQKFKINKA